MPTSHRSTNSAKARRNPGACDICRKRKIKCDSGERMGRTCTHCMTAGLQCTHKESTRSLGYAKSYITNLETRLEKMEKVLNRLLPGIDLSMELDRLADMPEPHETPPSDFRASPETSEALPQSEEEEDEDFEAMITRKVRKLDIGNRFYGKSSSVRLVITALNLKHQSIGRSTDIVFIPRKRAEFWDPYPWQWGNLHEELKLDVSILEYPDDDLLSSLVDSYFQNFNFFLPLLHRPTFERQIADCLHARNPMFGNVVLLVCALGAKYSDDPRVFTEGSNTTRSAGHKWYAQVNTCRKTYLAKPTLYELQMMILYLIFTKSIGNPPGTCVQVALGVKLAQEVGVHRRKPKKDGPISPEDELWKRAFWILFVYDRFMSALFGRSCTIHGEDYDQDYPIECDDEYWEHPDPSKRFQQPPDKPSTISYFNCYLRLMEIYGEVLRLLYPTRGPTPRLEQVVTDLDSAMNKWLDCVPKHLRWDPNQKNMLFLNQSAALYITYYAVQVLIHRPFISSPHNLSSTPIPSQAICINAARSSCYVVDVLNRLKISPPVFIQAMSGFTALVLLVSIWSGKRSGIIHNPRRELELLRKVLDMLSVGEQRWVASGRLKDIITELCSFGDMDGHEIVNQPETELDSDSWSPSPSPSGGYGPMDPSKPIPYHQQDIPSQPAYAQPLYSRQLGPEQGFTRKIQDDQLSKTNLAGTSATHEALSEGSSQEITGFSAQGPTNQGMDARAYGPGVLSDGQMAGTWQTTDIDNMTSWLLSTNVYQWENYFMTVDQQQELGSAHYV